MALFVGEVQGRSIWIGRSPAGVFSVGASLQSVIMTIMDVQTSVMFLTTQLHPDYTMLISKKEVAVYLLHNDSIPRMRVKFRAKRFYSKFELGLHHCTVLNRFIYVIPERKPEVAISECGRCQIHLKA